MPSDEGFPASTDRLMFVAQKLEIPLSLKRAGLI